MRNKIPFESEYKLHEFTQKNLEKLFCLTYVASEIPCDGSIMDTLAFNKQKNTFVIIEYKNRKNLKVIEQAQKYLDLLNNNKEFYVNRLKNMGDEDLEDINLGHIDFKNTQVMIIGPEFTKKQIENSDFDFWKITLYDDNRVIYENMETLETKELPINLNEYKMTEEETLKGKTETLCELYFNFKEKVMNNNKNVELRFLIDAVSFKVNKKIVCITYLHRKNKINIHYFDNELNDYKNKTKPLKENALGDYKLILNSEKDIDYACELFEEVYNKKKEKQK